jgi:hypothetical protein
MHVSTEKLGLALMGHRKISFRSAVQVKFNYLGNVITWLKRNLKKDIVAKMYERAPTSFYSNFNHVLLYYSMIKLTDIQLL